MSDKPENQLAFPTGNPTHGGHSGMTLRDYFAGQVLVGLIGRVWEDEHGNIPDGIFNRWALSSYEAADAMLKERGKTNE